MNSTEWYYDDAKDQSNVILQNVYSWLAELQSAVEMDEVGERFDPDFCNSEVIKSLTENIISSLDQYAGAKQREAELFGELIREMIPTRKQNS